MLNGEGRFGWSYVKTANLGDLKSKIEASGWNSLLEEEQKCYQAFLLDFKEDDYVVYVNLPEWGQCTLARVTGPYAWKFEDIEGSDFNHRFPVDRESVLTFDRNDAVVHPSLGARLKLQSRFWRVYSKDDFEDLIAALKRGESGATRTPKSNLLHLAKELQPLLTVVAEKIHRTHPNTDLEVLVAQTFKNVPGVKEVKCQGGAGDHGADVVVDFESGIPVPGLQRPRRCVVQVKSFEGEQWDTKAVSDIRRAFERYPEAELGCIVSTAASSTKEFDAALDKLREDTKKPVSLLIGADLARFILRFGDKA